MNKPATNLAQAVADLATIRRHVAGSTDFHGYGPLTLALTALLAGVAALLQARYLPQAHAHLATYLGIWISTAILSVSLITTEMIARTHRIHSGLADEMLRTAAQQFAPSLVIAVLITGILLRFAPTSTWMLPALWQICSSLGIFASLRYLPRPVLVVALWYAGTGLSVLALAGSRALSPAAMGLPYGVGQTLFALALLRAHRRCSDAL